MSLRDRQVLKFPLDPLAAFFWTVFATVLTFLLSVKLWQPFFGIIFFEMPVELRSPIGIISACLYLAQCTESVANGKERAQLLFGSYTGISYPAGIYLQPKLPFPILMLLFSVRESGYVLAEEVSIQSIVHSFEVESLTKDGIRVKGSGELVLEVSHVHTYLSQTNNGADRAMLMQAIRAQSSQVIKSEVIRSAKLEELLSGEHDNSLGKHVAGIVTEKCSFMKEYGLELRVAPHVHVEILSKQMEQVADRVLGRAFLAEASLNYATDFQVFWKKMNEEVGREVSFEVASMMYNASRADEGLPPVQISQLRFKG